MLAEQLDRAGLRPLLALLLDVSHPNAGFAHVESIIEHTIPVKIDLVAIGCFDEAKLATVVELCDRSDRLLLMLLHRALHAAHLVLQAPPRPLEGVVEREWQVALTFVRRGGARNINLAAVRQHKPNIHFVRAADDMMSTRIFEHNATGGDTTASLLQFGDVLFNCISECARRIESLKIDLDGRLHKVLLVSA